MFPRQPQRFSRRSWRVSKLPLGAMSAPTVERLAHTLEQQSYLSLSLSLVGLLLTASVLVRHLQLSFRAIWQYPSILISGPPIRAFLRMLAQKVVAYALVVGMGAILLLATLFRC